jgi:hypothetical protein
MPGKQNPTPPVQIAKQFQFRSFPRGSIQRDIFGGKWSHKVCIPRRNTVDDTGMRVAGLQPRRIAAIPQAVQQLHFTVGIHALPEAVVAVGAQLPFRHEARENVGF